MIRRKKPKPIAVSDPFEPGTSAYRKYHNVKTTVYDKEFDSKHEASVYVELLLRERQGEIRNLRCQVPFVLQEGFKDNQGKRHQAITYIADFVYEDKQGQVVTEAKGGKAGKGTETAVFAIKRKLFQKRYPSYRFEIRRNTT